MATITPQPCVLAPLITVSLPEGEGLGGRSESGDRLGREHRERDRQAREAERPRMWRRDRLRKRKGKGRGEGGTQDTQRERDKWKEQSSGFPFGLVGKTN